MKTDQPHKSKERLQLEEYEKTGEYVFSDSGIQSEVLQPQLLCKEYYHHDYRLR